VPSSSGDPGQAEGCHQVQDIATSELQQENMTMGTPTPRYDVKNLDQWGRLIKSWATHLDYVGEPDKPQPPRDYWVNKTWGAPGGPAPATILDIDNEGNPKPWCLPAGGPVLVPAAKGGSVTLPLAIAMTVDEFKTKVAAAHVEIKAMPGQYTHVIIVQGNVETMVMRLPPKDTLQGSEDDLLLSGQEYPLRSFYGELYPCEPNYPKTRPAIMELHANRIGEYTLNNCS
jgi:hypothetical protein